jgi:Zn-dependent membrane protease YugP
MLRITEGGDKMFWFYGYDPTYILVIISFVISLWAQFKVQSTFSKYSKVKSSRGITGAMAAEKILSANGITDVRIERVQGNLTDHYDPRKKVLRLSAAVHDSDSLSALGVAAHEVGHAIQHAKKYAPLSIRNTIVPVVNIASHLAVPLFLLGLFFTAFEALIWVGIWCFIGVVIFQFITLPVEFNASSRAIASLTDTGIVDSSEAKMSRRVLNAAAMTYVAATITSLLQLLRLLAIARRRD